MDNLIEQIKRDREDGTPGPWVFQALTEDEWILPDVEEWSISAPSNSYFMGNTPFYPYVSDNMADARRIARVPELEAALLEAVEVLETINEVFDIGITRDVLAKIKGDDDA